MSKHTQPLREFYYLMKKFNESETPEKQSKYADKINNWKRSYPNTWQYVVNYNKNMKDGIYDEVCKL